MKYQEILEIAKDFSKPLKELLYWGEERGKFLGRKLIYLILDSRFFWIRDQSGFWTLIIYLFLSVFFSNILIFKK